VQWLLSWRKKTRDATYNVFAILLYWDRTKWKHFEEISHVGKSLEHIIYGPLSTLYAVFFSHTLEWKWSSPLLWSSPIVLHSLTHSPSHINIHSTSNIFPLLFSQKVRFTLFQGKQTGNGLCLWNAAKTTITTLLYYIIHHGNHFIWVLYYINQWLLESSGGLSIGFTHFYAHFHDYIRVALVDDFSCW